MRYKTSCRAYRAREKVFCAPAMFRAVVRTLRLFRNNVLKKFDCVQRQGTPGPQAPPDRPYTAQLPALIATFLHAGTALVVTAAGDTPNV